MILVAFRIIGVLVELFLVTAIFWFFANVFRFFFFKGSAGGGMFSLSDKWLSYKKSNKVKERK